MPDHPSITPPGITPPVEPPPRSFGSAMARLMPHARPYAPRFAAGIVAAVGAAALGLAIPQALQYIVNTSLDGGGYRELWIGVAVVLVLGIGEAALTIARRRLITTPGTTFESDLRILIYRHLADLPPSVHDRYSGGQLLSRSISDVRRFRRWLTFGISQTVVNTFTIGAGLALITLVDPILGLIYFIGCVPAVAVSFRARSRYHDLARVSQDQIGDLGATVEQSVHGIRVLKAFGREDHAVADYIEQAGELRSTELRKADQKALIAFAMSAIPDALLGVLLVVGLLRVVDGHLTIGGLLAVFTTAAIMGGPLERISEQFTMTMDAKAALSRFGELLDQLNTVSDPPDPRPLPEGPGRVEFDGVDFSYDGSTTVLEDLNLVIEPGETLALIGLTGSGKTAIGQLVGRFRDVDAGSVRVDGTDVREVTRHDLRALVSVVFDEPLLFSSTIAENVALGAPDATDEELATALRVAKADFVDRLPDGIHTRIGEEGLTLSGGQRQRLSLARAIAARPRVLVLDDPLSALDVHTERVVADRLRAHLADTTTLLIASRPSTVTIADRVAVVHEGRIVAIGTHAELRASSALYRAIVGDTTPPPAPTVDASTRDPIGRAQSAAIETTREAIEAHR
ncbi:ABC transporter ATP-binding protein [Millisia brevis]|uniref:ABC transporter ATP-binding protein n=1 Tax=Millisia brevis TaxID=264148 RepID=UPI001C3F26BF|nr:ABC transporter ATP-binding protein [Millisia brevis]